MVEHIAEMLRQKPQLAPRSPTGCPTTAEGDPSLAFTLSSQGKPRGKRERLHTWTCPSGLHIGSLHQKIMPVLGVRSPLKSLTRGGATRVRGLTGDRRRRDKDSGETLDWLQDQPPPQEIPVYSCSSHESA